MSKSIEKSFVILCVSGLLFACNMTGEKVMDRGPLKIYFSETTNEKIVGEFADYWIIYWSAPPKHKNNRR